jgi:hypothetical protein
MNDRASEVEKALALTLADGAVWNIRAGDALAEGLVGRFGSAMRLAAGSQSARELLVIVDRAEGSARLDVCVPRGSVSQPFVLRVREPLDPIRLGISMQNMGLLIGRDAQSRGGLLLHGALAEFPAGQAAQGVLLAGPGSSGKTTASGRLPPPWRSLCDDTALVVRDARGQYWAHPWPTWSRFFGGNGGPGPGGSWEVQRAIPLRAIFFLEQSAGERVTPLKPVQTVSLLMESVEQTSYRLRRYLSEDDLNKILLERLANTNGLARSVPAFMLQLSLTGAFWREMESVLSSAPSQAGQVLVTADGRNGKEPAEPRCSGSTAFVLSRGLSMQPTLMEPDLLEIHPYGERPVRRGDVVCYRRSESRPVIVHRVVRVTPQGIRTRGDNNPEEDSPFLQPADICGRVVAVWRRQRRWRVAAGWPGQVAGWKARVARLLRRLAGALLADLYRALSRSGVVYRLTPARLRPRVVCFLAPHGTFLKLLLGKWAVGQYDFRERRWRIRPPFRLFVNETALPQFAGSAPPPGPVVSI